MPYAGYTKIRINARRINNPETGHHMNIRQI
jgi:hypothetical protein